MCPAKEDCKTFFKICICHIFFWCLAVIVITHSALFLSVDDGLHRQETLQLQESSLWLSVWKLVVLILYDNQTYITISVCMWYISDGELGDIFEVTLLNWPLKEVSCLFQCKTAELYFHTSTHFIHYLPS